MPPLDDLLNEAARAGRLKKLTLWRDGDRWQANASADGISWRVEINSDPAIAIAAALRGFAPNAAPAAPDDIFG